MAVRKRRRHVALNLFVLVSLLTGLLFLYVFLREKETGENIFLGNIVALWQKSPESKFENNQYVIVSGDNQVGKIVSSSIEIFEGNKEVYYTVRYNESDERKILEQDLTLKHVPFELNQLVALKNGYAYGELSDGIIDAIYLNEAGDNFVYTADFPTVGRIENLTMDDLVWIYSPDLSEENQGIENHKIIQEAILQSTSYSYSRLVFPSGKFLIGSHDSENNYIVLESNLELVGNNTTLVVDGVSYWLGLTTGPAATDGLSNFVMKDLFFEAKDLQEGAEFKLMANHGYNWQILNNRFSLVHKMSSHIFDLGGVRYALFDSNIFEGYAPNLTNETEVKGRDLHNFYSEAIQLDASLNNGLWDGGLLKKIDPNYEVNNPDTQITSNVTIINNQFLPYYNGNHELVAYGATIGQHSSEVGEVSIYNNYFKNTLSSRFIDNVDSTSQFLMKPIHFVNSSYDYSTMNMIE